MLGFSTKREIQQKQRRPLYLDFHSANLPPWLLITYRGTARVLAAIEEKDLAAAGPAISLGNSHHGASKPRLLPLLNSSHLDIRLSPHRIVLHSLNKLLRRHCRLVWLSYLVP